jgi:hypothetical protein
MCKVLKMRCFEVSESCSTRTYRLKCDLKIKCSSTSTDVKINALVEFKQAVGEKQLFEYDKCYDFELLQ